MNKPSRYPRRFFSTSSIPEKRGIVFLDESETHHLRDILRLQVGDHCLVCDGSGCEAEARIVHLSRGSEAQLRIEKVLSRDLERSLVIHVAVALPQKGKMDKIVEKAQEWGVDEIWPMETERTILKLSGAQKTKVCSRWHKIAVEAAKQSGSVRLLKIREPVPFETAVAFVKPPEEIALFHPGPEAIPFRNWIRGLDKGKGKALRIRSPGSAEGGSSGIVRRVPTLNLFFGPEGGFSKKEMEWIADNPHAKQISLGKAILKVDTALLGVVSALRLLFP